MNAPLKLTERQLLIYFYLYKKCDFDNMEVKITTSQIVAGVKIIDLTDRIVNAELKKMIEAGFLKLVKKGSKGNFSIYKIIKTNEMLVTNAYVISNSKDSNSNALESDGVTNAYVISNSNTKNKEKENNIYSEVIKYLNEKANTNYRPSTKNTQSFISARLKEGFTVEDFKKVINVKAENWIGTDFEKYLRPATLFGTKFENYLNEANKKGLISKGHKENIKTNSSICNTGNNYTQKIEVSKFI
jgi:uncharacterized phage protein (TIGR02220 family)